MIPDLVSLSSEEPGQTLNLRLSLLAMEVTDPLKDGDDEEEEEKDDDEGGEGGVNTYIDRGMEEPSAGSTSCMDSQDASGVTRESSGFCVESSPPAAVELWQGPPPGVKSETGINSGDQAGILGSGSGNGIGNGIGSGSGGVVEGWGLEKGDHSGDINLLSVTLGMSEEEEEEEEEEKEEKEEKEEEVEEMEEMEEEQNATESSAEGYDKTQTPLPTFHCGGDGYDSRDRNNTFSGFHQSGAGDKTVLLCGAKEDEEEDEEEEEEEEELSGYMGRW